MAVTESRRRQRRRHGRGQLSSLDRLPPSADDAVAWANTQLREYNLTQGEILGELNARLANLGIPPITRSAFSRYSVRLTIGARTAKASQVAAIDLFDHMRVGAPSDARQLIVDALRFVIVQLLTGDEVDFAQIDAASRLLISIVRGDKVNV